MINETLILHSPPHTCYIHIIHKLQNTSSILWKKFCTARLIEFKWSTFEFLKVIDIYGHWENYKGISGKNEMCFDWMQRTHRTWAPPAMSVWLHASKNTGYPPRISNRSELKDHFRQVWIWSHSPRGAGVTSKQCFLTLKAEDKAINIYLS